MNDKIKLWIFLTAAHVSAKGVFDLDLGPRQASMHMGRLGMFSKRWQMVSWETAALAPATISILVAQRSQASSS